MRKFLSIILFTLCACLSLMAQGQKDSLVVLVSSKSAQLVDVDGASYRKVVGPARFLHNDTYLLCDTAYWNVETEIIDAWGHVSILQEETVLTSDKLTYLVKEDLAQFRGSVVQLTDKDHNTLRTRHLDYNTKDSVAVFMNGGAMRDKDGQIIESRRGTYDSKNKTFTFVENVNMFTDSIFVKTSNLVYESDLSLATFGAGTNAWKEENMLSSEKGWYDSAKELFLFSDTVHVMSEEQEGWCDSLFFNKLTSDVEMLGNAQVSDTTRNVYALAGRIEYMDSLSKVTLTRSPAVISRMDEENGAVDTVYLGAQKLVYMTRPKFEVDSMTVVLAEQRLEAMNVDPVGEYRKKAAEAAAKAMEQAVENDPNLAAKKAAAEKKAAEAAARKAATEKKAQAKQTSDTLSRPDSLKTTDSLMVSDSLHVMDSMTVVEPAKDSTKIGFLEAIKDVRIYKKDMQIVCDSLLYSDLDSLARMFKEPMIWQEGVRQYSADSVSVLVRDGAMDKASLMSEAFIVIEEDSTHYNQIKGMEMLAFFDDKGGLERFDVLGGASALFYIEENGAYATVNKTDSKMLSATFADGELQRIHYYDQPKNDGYPKVQLSDDERKLKGYNWQPQRRPVDRTAVTSLSLRPSQRMSYKERPRAEFKQTDIYFPGYIADIHRQIEVRDSLRKVRAAEKKAAEAALEKARLDSLALKDSLFRVDSLMRVDSLARVDSLKLAARADSLAVADSLKHVRDSLSVADSLAAAKVLTPEEIKAAKKTEAQRKKEEAAKAREAARKKKQEEKEKRWAELDKRDEQKAKAKEEKRKAKERERKRKALQASAREAEKDARVLETYIEKYRKQKEKDESQ